GRFRVRVLSQVSGRPRLDEARALGMNPAGKAIIRQVLLLCDGKPWIYARTIIPMSSLRGRLRRLAQLGSRPLGGMLFADPGMRRELVELARIRRGQAMYADATRGLRTKPAEVWGRRAVFRIARRPLLVSEVFLPDFPVAATARPLWKSRWQ
ncbi:MAG: chorismate lyase, partial [Thiohalobacterales bacterium]|nr:chorismate lyase [Thiohalobacterales bacterium]